MSRAVFLDRDGVINRRAPEGDYITRWEDFVFLDGAAESIAKLNRTGFLVIVVSNQRCIAKGLVSASQIEQMHHRMAEVLEQAGARIDAVYYCPHELESACGCRKPAPGMLLDAAATHAIDLKNSWMVGDSKIDIAAGKNAGCKTVWIREVRDERQSVDSDGPDLLAASLKDAVLQILGYGTDRARSTGNKEDGRVFAESRLEIL